MLVNDARLNDLTGSILSAAIEVHRVLGPGLLESICTTCTQYELAARHLRFVPQQAIPVTYKGVRLESIYRVDLVVEDLVVVEVKCVDSIAGVHKAQVITYLRLTGCPAGLLINFNAPRLMDGVKRLINPFPRQPPSGQEGTVTTGTEGTEKAGYTEERSNGEFFLKKALRFLRCSV
jgi:GxxExxY protein